jgi:uncharacterized RDD family membrane protein YckC
VAFADQVPRPDWDFNYQGNLAGLLDRFVASLIDFSLLASVLILLAPTIPSLAPPSISNLESALGLISLLWGLYTLMFLALGMVYFTALESATGQTLGKRIVDIIVVDPTTGRPPATRRAVIRSLFRFVDWLPTLYLLGFLVARGSRSKQRLGDLAAHTVVVRNVPRRPW